MNVWKIGSRWGNLGTSVLDLFLNYECVFFGNCHGGEKLGNWASVQEGDFFVICDGETTVALGRSYGRFSEYHKSSFHFTKRDYEKYIEDDDVSICPAKIVILPPDERVGHAHRLRFCRYGNQEFIEKLPRLWKELSSPSDFKIIPRTVSLFSGAESIFASNVRYRIPIYQRPYSWGENELRKLMESLRDAVRAEESVFMGTMQLSQPIPLNPSGTTKAYNIIDGQQRITTFMILCNVLEKHLNKSVIPYAEDKFRTLVSRGEEQIKLDEYSEFIKNPELCKNLEQLMLLNQYIRNYQTIDTLLKEYCNQDDASDNNPTEEEIYEFLKHKQEKVQIVIIETHAGLSKTLQIFNTINTAGMDLGATDLFKIRFYEYLKNNGYPDSVFDQISDVYAAIEKYNRAQKSPAILTMQDVLRTYQRVISTREGLPQSAFRKSYETFFEELFDTLLHIRAHDDFKSMAMRETVLLSVDDLQKIIACYEENYDLLATDWHFRIIRNMIWETRYGYAWDLPIIARFFGSIEENQIFEFTLRLFKLLCPPSLYRAKIINPVRSALIDMSKKLHANQCNGVDILRHCLLEWHFDGSLEEMLINSCEFEVAFNPKWKNLICRLVEYLKSPNKNQALFKRLWQIDMDIEHIQCFTDEKDAEQVRKDWGAELNRLGNLVLLERGINRSIRNRAKEKPDAYHESIFVSVAELAKLVGGWSKTAAEKRRLENTELIKSFILS